MDINKQNNQQRVRPGNGSTGQPAGPMPHAESVQNSKGTTIDAMRALEKARQASQVPAQDQMVFSETARKHVASSEQGESLRASLVSELRQSYQEGSLNSLERMDEAARRLLGA